MDKLVNVIRTFYQQETMDLDQLRLYRMSSVAKAKIRGFIEALRHSKTEQTVGACYESVVGEYVELFLDPQVQSIVLAAVVHFMERAHAKRILDAGCGLGLEASFLAKCLTDATITATDISPKMICKARERVARLGLQNVFPIIAAHSELSNIIGKASFDFAYVFGSFHFITDNECRENFIQFAQVLENEGILVICGPLDVDTELYKRCARMAGFRFVGPVKTICFEKKPRTLIWRFVKSI